MNTTKSNWLKIIIVLGCLAILAIVAGWGSHFVLDALSNVTAPATAALPTITTVTQETELTPTPLATVSEIVAPDSTSTPTQSTSTPKPTSTQQPTSTPAPTSTKPTVITVKSGENLYQVCRNYCNGCWGAWEVPLSLRNYAQTVAYTNGRGINDTLYRGTKLTMPPCPSECP